MRTKALFAFAFLTFAASVSSNAASKVDADWQAFKKDSARYMNTRPAKRDERGGALCRVNI
jgi:hypothetical protein